MAGFGSLGGLGGRPGGFGASFPTRNAAPNSMQIQTVDELQAPIWQERDAYLSGLERDRQEADATLSAHAVTQMGGTPNLTGAGLLSAQNALSGFARDRAWHGDTGGVMHAFATPNSFEDAQQYSTAYGRSDDILRGFDQRAQEVASAYNQNRDRQQQSYNSMAGGNQINGILGPEYANPNFGQIGAQTPEVPEGTDMEWAADVYRPGDTFTAPRPTSKGWNFW